MYQEPGYEITGRRRVNPVYQEQTASPVACMRYGEECGRAGWRSVLGGESGTHFNPVDLVCAVKNYKGEKYNLPDYVDKNTGFISYKSKDGRELKALELPGLWNGAMSDWNTVFVEVPIETFNPVKTVNDLLRPEHQ